jgi:hypothetical protein
MGIHPDAFDSCDRLTLVVAPRASGLVGASISGVAVVDDTKANRRRVLHLQDWRGVTHAPCSHRRRNLVRTVLLVANRVLGGPLTLPREMWYHPTLRTKTSTMTVFYFFVRMQLND